MAVQWHDRPWCCIIAVCPLHFKIAEHHSQGTDFAHFQKMNSFFLQDWQFLHYSNKISSRSLIANSQSKAHYLEPISATTKTQYVGLYSRVWKLAKSSSLLKSLSSLLRFWGLQTWIWVEGLPRNALSYVLLILCLSLLEILLHSDRLRGRNHPCPVPTF